MAFKENVNDIRNSKSIELAKHFIKNDYNVHCYDPLVNKLTLKKEHNISLTKPIGKYNCLIVSVSHSDFKKMNKKSILSLLKSNSLIVDIRGTWEKINFPSDFRVWRL